MRGDRTLYAKTLSEQKQEIADYRTKFDHLNIRIAQIKQEINDKDHTYLTSYWACQKVTEEINKIKSKIAKTNKQNQMLEETIKTQVSWAQNTHPVQLPSQMRL